MRSEARGLSSEEDPLHGELAARFRALREHPEAQRLLRAEGQEDSDDPSPSPPIHPLVGFLALTVAIGALLAATGAMSLICPPLMAIPIAGLVVLAITVSGHLLRARRRPDPVQRFGALVLSKRTLLHAGTGDVARTDSRVTLLFPDGVKREFGLSEDAEESIHEGAMGVASLRGERLVRFDIVSV
ncbi:MAG TPA: hypothetical protein ENJ09_00075 [Planctomycetes bacterium]|nr:hypothetical protein [Planctomycetota bacterium]